MRPLLQFNGEIMTPHEQKSLVAVDFETWYDKGRYDIGRFGPHMYCAHEEFDPYLVSINGFTSNGSWIDYVGPVQDFDWRQLANENIAMHNAGFDQLVIEESQRRGLIPKEFKPAQYICTADLAVWLGYPRNLSQASQMLVKMQMKKSTRDKMSGLRYEDALKQGLKDELHEYAKQDAVAAFRIAAEYVSKWPEDERRIANSNRAQGDYGVQIDVEYLENSIDRLQILIHEARKKIPWKWEEEYKTPLAPTLIRTECNKVGIPMPASLAKDRPECLEWEDTYASSYPWIHGIRTWRRGNMLLQKLEAMQRRTDTEGVMRFRLKYIGSHTRRFSGDQGVNMQNLPRSSFEGVDMRKCVIPREGKVFGIIDYSQIEARLLLHRAGDIKTLNQVRQGIDIYEAHARSTMDYRDPRPLNQVNPKMRRYSKCRVLGLGYGCGKVKFVSLAKTMGGLTLTEEESEDAVKAYRTSNPLVTKYWRLHHECFLYSAHHKHADYRTELLNGKELIYNKPHFEKNEEGYSGYKAQVVHGLPSLWFWGGKLTENEQQADAREILCDAMIRLEDAGFRVLFNVHDELVLEFDRSSAESDLKEAMTIMTNAPDWLGDCPLGVEGHLATSFSKSDAL
jgi:DNA polymerase I-like protein with 3'-5' exonuclease and polymerase domains